MGFKKNNLVKIYLMPMRLSWDSKKIIWLIFVMHVYNTRRKWCNLGKWMVTMEFGGSKACEVGIYTLFEM